MIEVASGRTPAAQPLGRPDVKTHQLLLAILGAAQQGQGRRRIITELIAAARHSGDYRDSIEELTPIAGDWRAGIPGMLAAAATLVKPTTWEWFSGGSVQLRHYVRGLAPICTRPRDN